MSNLFTFIPEADYLSIKQCADLKKASKRTVLKWIEKKQLRAIKIDGFYIVNMNDLLNFQPRKVGRPKTK